MDGLLFRRRRFYRSRAAIVKVMFSSFLTLTTPPTEMGVMPKSVCLMTNLPVAVSRSPAILTETGAVTVCVLP